MIVSELAEKLAPYLGIVATGGSGGIGVHSLQGSAHIGALGDYQAPQFLKLDGSRPITGNIIVNAGITVDGVDISAHVASPDSHHQAFVGMRGPRGEFINPDANLRVWLSEGRGINISSAGAYITIATDENVVLTSRQIISGQGMIGGGPLTVDRTLDVVAGDASMLINPDSLVVNRASNGGLIATSGLGINYGTGLDISSNLIYVDVSQLDGPGLTISGTQLALGTPDSVAWNSPNSVSLTSHNHAVVSSSSPGITTSLLRTNEKGGIILGDDVLHVNPELGNVWINSGTPDGSAAVKITPLDPSRSALIVQQIGSQIAPIAEFKGVAGDTLFLVQQDGSLRSGQFASGTLGWIVYPNGDAEFNNLRARGELHSSVFVADEIHATGGTLLVLTSSVLAEEIVVN